MFGKLSDLRLSHAFLVVIFACLLSLFIEFKQIVIVGFIPDYDDLSYVSPWVCLFLLSLQFWMSLLRAIGLESRLSIAAGFFAGFVAFLSLTYLPPAIGQIYLTVTGLLGLVSGAFQLFVMVRTLSNWLVASMAVVTGLLAIPAIWTAVGWILFSLPHPDFLTMFSVIHGWPVAVFDLLHFLSYSQMIHEHGVPSVGMNGLAFHQYHWLAGYPVSSLATLSGMAVPEVVAGFTGTFLTPFLFVGILLGAILASSSAFARVLTVGISFAIYGVASQTMPAIAFGLVFISPSMALSLALFAPLAGMVVSVLDWRNEAVPLGYVWLFVVGVVLVGLAKITTLPHAVILILSFGAVVLLHPKVSLALKGQALAALMIAGLATAFLLYSGGQQLRTVVDEPTGYTAMLESLSPEDRSQLVSDIKTSRASQAISGATDRLSYEKSNFWNTVPGVVGIFLVASMFAVGLLAQWRQSLFVKIVLLLPAIGLFSYLILRLFIGQQTPVQAVYVLLPILIFASYLVGSAFVSSMTAFFGQAATRANRTIGMGALIAVLVLFSGANITTAMLGQKTVSGFAAKRAIITVGQLASPRGKELIGSIVGERAQTFRVGNYPDWPASSSRYWTVWDSLPLGAIKNEAHQLKEAMKATGEKVALFVPVDHAFWAQSENVSRSLWFPGVVGVPLYRGRTRRAEGEDVTPYRGRGFSDFGHEASSPIKDFRNVHCWSRFDGWTIIELGATTNRLKC